MIPTTSRYIVNNLYSGWKRQHWDTILINNLYIKNTVKLNRQFNHPRDIDRKVITEYQYKVWEKLKDQYMCLVNKITYQ